MAILEECRLYRTNRIKKHGIDSEQVRVAFEFIALPNLSNLETARNKIRDSFGINKNTIIAGGAGHEIWRKSKDIFIQVSKPIV